MAEPKDKTNENAAVLEQFKRNLTHVLIGNTAGPEITLGDTVLTFRKKAPVKALAALIAIENRVEGMKQYILLSLVKGQEESFEELLDDIDVEGLSEILNALGEGYTSFPETS